MDIFTQEFAAGAILIAAGGIVLKLQQCEWYRAKFFSGYWRYYNTPTGLLMANLQCAGVIVMGVVMCCGFIPFDR